MTESTPIAPVTVVIPAYNSAAFIQEAIESVHRQTLPAAELIVVVDDSTDNTAEIAESMGARVLSNGRNGLCAARNLGVRAATQPWIAFLDSDDIWQPDKIARQMEFLTDHPDISLVVCDYNIFRGRGTVCASALDKYRSGYDSQPKRSCDHGAIIEELDPVFADAYYFLLASNVIVRKETLEQVGMFEGNLASADDFDCYMRVMARNQLGIVEKVLVRRREHDSNTSAFHPRAATAGLEVTYKVLENPERYPAATVKLCGEWLPSNLRHAGASLLLSGNTGGARGLLWKSLKLQLSWRTLLALGASLAPRSIARGIMSARYYVSRTVGI